MKTLFTSCYGRSKNLPPDMTQVRTSRGVPDWWKPSKRLEIPGLAPAPTVMNAAKSGAGDWKTMYRRQIEALDAKGNLARLVEMIPDNSVLLCFEANHCDCHRKILAEYLTEKGMATVKEWVTEPVLKPKKAPLIPPQLLLF